MADSLKVRRAQRRDIPRLAELWAHAFPGERSVNDRVRQLEAGGVYGGIEHAWFVEREGLVAGAFRGYPLLQYIHGSPVRLLGVAAVAVAAHARRAGLGAELCRAALRIGRERGDLLSALYPFRPDFYQRLGWGLTGELHAYRFRGASLPVRVEQPRVRLVQQGDLPDVQACYQRVASRSHGMIERTGRMWANHVSAPLRHLFALPDRSGVRGYLLVSYGRSRRAEERVLLVHELVAEDAAAYEELLSWLAVQRDEWPVIEYHALPEERFDLRLTDPRPPRFHGVRGLWTPTCRQIRGPMLRVLAVPGALHAREHWPEATSFEFTLTVRDPELPENEGPWHVAFDGSRVQCTPARDGEAQVRLGAAAFAQLYAGELSLSEAVRLGFAECDGSTLPIDALFRSTRTLRLLDEF